jgi:D-mannonate dehydratase
MSNRKKGAPKHPYPKEETMQLDQLPMRVAAGQFSDLTDEIITFTKQVGLKDVQLNMYGNAPPLPGKERWEYMDLLRLRTRCEDAGLRLNAIENTPPEFYDKAMLGLPGRDEQIENMRYTIRNIGRAGIPIFGYHFMPSRVWRTSNTTPARGGAQVTAFDMELVKQAPLTNTISRLSCPWRRKRGCVWRCTRTIPRSSRWGVWRAL